MRLGNLIMHDSTNSKQIAKAERITLFGGGHNWRVRKLTIWGWDSAYDKPFNSKRAAEDWILDNNYELID